MVQGLPVAWWFSGEFDQIVNQSHNPNDRCDRVGAEEVSGPVLENTGGPPGRSLQLQVCQWCWKEIWRFEFVDDRRWSSSSKKWYFGWADNLRKPETRHTDIFDEIQIIASNNSWWHFLVVVHIDCDVRQCRTCKLILQPNKCQSSSTLLDGYLERWSLSSSCNDARPNDPINMRQFFWMVFWGKIYTRSELQILTQVLIGLRDDSKKVWTVSEDNCFCRAFYPSGRLHWDKRDYFITYKNPTPISSANHLALLIYLWVMSDPLH